MKAFFEVEFFMIISVYITSTIKMSYTEDLPLNIKDVCDLSNERFPDRDHNVSDILQTYEDCLKSLDQYSGPTKEFLLKQLSDRLQCFKEDLKHMYYAGNIKYSDVELVENLEVEIQKGIKLDLNDVHNRQTNCNFERPVRSTVKHIIPLVVTGTTEEKKRACDAIFKLAKGGNITQLDILTPKLDNNLDPKEITVPLKHPTTYKIDSPQAENVLPQFYKVIMKCLTLTTGHKIQVFKFNKRFYEWLTQAVLPHLKDDKCYPAFGGVLRIVETMRQNDFVPKNATANFIFYRQRDLDQNPTIQEQKKKQNTTGRIFFFSYFPLIIFTWLLFVLILLIFFLWRSGRCVCMCCNCCGKNDDNDDDLEYSAEGISNAWCTKEVSFRKKMFYYPIEETPSISLDLDEISSVGASLKSSATTKTEGEDKNENESKKQNETQVYSMTCEHQHILTSLPLKRHFSSRNSFSSNEIKSPAKQYKKMWPDYY